MICSEMQPEIGALADGHLTGAEAEPLRAHLRGCAACRRVYDEIRALRQVLNEVRLPDAPPAATAALAAAIRPEPAVQWTRWVPAVAAAAVIGAVAWIWAAGGVKVSDEVKTVAARFDAPGPIRPAATVAAARRILKTEFGAEAAVPEMKAGYEIEGCSTPFAGVLSPMVFYRAGDKRLGLVFSAQPFPDLPPEKVKEIGGLKCAMIEHEGKTIMFCQSKRGHHIWVARMAPRQLMALVKQFAHRKPAEPSGLRFIVKPMG